MRYWILLVAFLAASCGKWINTFTACSLDKDGMYKYYPYLAKEECKQYDMILMEVECRPEPEALQNKKKKGTEGMLWVYCEE